MKTLVVKAINRNYNKNYEPTFVSSFAEAKRLLENEQFEVLDLPGENRRELFAFLKELGDTRYMVAVHGVDNERKFVKIRDKIREMGFEFLD